MARIQTVLAAIKRSPQDHLPSRETVDQICREVDHDYRDRVLSPYVFIQLFCLQVLGGNTAVNHLRHLSGVNFSSSSYCEARKNLPLKFFEALLKRMADTVGNHNIKDQMIGPDRRIVFKDGSTFSMPDIPELREYFGLPPGQAEGIGYPVAKFMALLDHVTAMFVRFAPMPNSTHDMAGASALHPELKSGDILVADCAFCSVVHLLMLVAMGVDSIFCLHQRRPKKAGRQHWRKPPARERPDWIEQVTFLGLSEGIDIRIVEHVIRRKGFRNQVIHIATTLLDESQWPDEVIIRIYGERWNIETCFNHLKTTMGMNVLKCKSLDCILKELAVYLIVYNMVRLVMLRAAEAQSADVSRISFIDAMRQLMTRMIGLPGVDNLIINPSRPHRLEPRARRRRPNSYPYMTKPRHHMKAAIFVGKMR